MKGKCCLFSLLIILAMTFVFPVWDAYVEEPEGLILYVSFEEQGQLIDHSPDPTDVSIIGELKRVDGKIGKALEFDGEPANYVEVADSGKLYGMKAITIEAWVMPFGPNVNVQTIVSKRLEFQNKDTYNLFLVQDMKLKGRINGQDGVAISTETFFDGMTWYHVAYVFDGDPVEGERQKLYVNGILETTLSHPHESVDKNEDVSLWIGILNISPGAPGAGPWIGVIDEVRMWNRALSEKEVKSAMDGSIMSVKPQGKLAARWGDIKSR